MSCDEIWKEKGVLGCVVQLALNFGQSRWGVGAGFVVAGRNGPFVATAFHNLSGGVSVEERKAGAYPNPVQVELYYEGREVAKFMPYVRQRSLFRMQDHPEKEKAGWCDVATLSLSTLAEWKTKGDEDEPFWSCPGIGADLESRDYALRDDMFLAAGRDTLVFGYPGGREYFGDPIGVGCKIASCGGQEPQFLLCGPSSAGCSGAPVVARDFGGYWHKREGILERKSPHVPIVDQWLGLYSGRLESVGSSAERDSTQIGVVWSAQSVQMVAFAGTRDSI